MSNTIGSVNFTTHLDGRRTPGEAKTIGQKAGAAAAGGYDEKWETSFRDTLSKSGKASYAAWTKSGKKDGGVYGATFTRRLNTYLAQARKNFEGLRLNPGFLDDFAKGFGDAGLAAGELQRQLKTLKEDGLNGNAYKAAKRQVEDWAEAQRAAAIETKRSSDEQRDSINALHADLRREINATAIATVDANDRQRHSVQGLQEDLRRASNEYLIMSTAQEEQARRETQFNADRVRTTNEHLQARRNLLAVIEQNNDAVRHSAANWNDADGRATLLRRSVESLSNSVHEQSFHWKDLSHNVRQWTLIIGAVLTGMEDLAVLGSAAGAGLVAVGAAATSGVIGVGGLAAVFVTLNKDLEDLPDNLRPVAAEFKRFTPVFTELRDTIATGAFRQLPGVFNQMGDSLRALSPAFDSLGTSVGRTFRIFATETKPGTKAFQEIQRTIELAGPGFEDLARTAGVFGEAFLRAFNRAQPLVEDLYGWLRRLGRQFNDFTQSAGFDEWMRGARVTFGEFGALLDAVGRSLNDLVTPESISRTAEFLKNLTAFMPNFTKFLQNLGEADVFGLLAQALNDLGRGFAPLSESTGKLLDALNRIVSISLSELGDALVGISQALAPIVDGFADFLNSLPPDAIAGMANGVLILAGAFAVLSGARGISGAVTAMDGFVGTARGIGPAAGRAATAITAVGTAAGVAAAALLIGIPALENWIDETHGTSDAARTAVASHKTIVESLNDLNQGYEFSAAEIKRALDGEAAREKDFWGTTGDERLKHLAGLEFGLKKFSEQLASQDVTTSSLQFQAWTTELGLSNEQMLTMLNDMPEFKQVLQDTAVASGGLATDQGLLALALSATGDAATNASPATTDYGYSIEGIATKAALSKEQLDALSERIRSLGEEVLQARSASREYEAAIDDLTASVAENGATLDITEASGRANEAALDALAEATKVLAAETLENTGKQEDANAVINAGRDELIKQLGQFGITGAAADEYVRRLGLIPSNIATKVSLDSAAAQAGIDSFVRTNNGRTIRIFINGQFDTGAGTPKGFASGGLLHGPQVVLAGEAGPEAIVPLRRNLSQVDPDVRWLSAIAQGKDAPKMAAGGIAGAGRSIVIEAGAIVVQTTSDNTALIANDLLDRIVERIG